MKNKYLFILLASILISIECYSQSNFGFSGSVPLKENYAPLFGKDIIINDQPNQDQRNVRVCSAFNGLLYSVFSFVSADNFPVFRIMKSNDNGLSWSILCDNLYPTLDYQFKTLDIAVMGDSIQNLKVIVAGVLKTQTFDMGEGLCFSFNGVTGEFENTLLAEDIAYDMALATDNGFPSTNSNPSSVGLLCSKSGDPDTLFFFSSSNGGLSLDSKRTVAVTQKKLLNVALAYGKCATYPNGNYFAAWLEHENYGDVPGHIYTAHTSPYFNSTFTPTINLDSLDSRNINNCKNPAIACQYGNFDNDSSNITEVVFFDAIDQSSQFEDIKGYYNINAYNHSRFNRLIVSDSSHQNVEPDVNFNPYDSTFLVTYYDKSLQKLPFISNNFNFLNPNIWVVESPGYNDNTNIPLPYPKVEIGGVQKKGINVWTADQLGGNGVSMSDSQMSTWTGFSTPDESNYSCVVKFYPNPCSDHLSILFDLDDSKNVTINVLSMTGQCLKVLTNKTYQKGRSLINSDISTLSMGAYLLNFQVGEYSVTKQISIIR